MCAICEGPSFFDCFHRRFYFAPNGERFKSKLAVQGYLEGRSTDLDKNSRETNSKPEPLTEPKVRLPESVTLGVLEGGSKGLDKNSSDINAKQLTTEVTVKSSAPETVPQNRYKTDDCQSLHGRGVFVPVREQPSKPLVPMYPCTRVNGAGPF